SGAPCTALPPAARLACGPPSLRVGVEAFQELRTELAHVAGAERDHEVACAGDLPEMLDDARPVTSEIRDVAMSVRADPIGEILPRDAGDRRLAGPVDVHHDQHVSQVERREELLS